MKKLMIAVATAAMVLGLAGASSAACIANNNDQICDPEAGDWHFVNNQTRGAARGMIEVEYSSGELCQVLADTDRGGRNTQHFQCDGYTGSIVEACTDLPGRLVLSDFDCDDKEPPCEGKDCEPPPCEGKDCP